MKKLIYIKTLLIVCLLVVTLPLHATNEAEYKQIKKTYTINEDGSYSLRVCKEIKLLTHKAFNDIYGESFIIYNPKRQSVKINDSYTTQADGTVIKTPTNAFNEVLPFSAASAPAFNHLRELVVTHTGLELGATIYLDYTLTTTPADKSTAYFDISEQITESSPVKEYTISITAPSTTYLGYELLNSRVKPKVSGNTIQWIFRNLPAAAIESYKSQNGDAPRLIATTLEANSVAERYSKIADIKYESLANTLTADIKSEDKKLETLVNYVVRGTNLSPLPFSYQDNTERCLKLVSTSGYATKMEKAVLLNSLLNSVGVSSEFVFIYPNTIDSSMLTYSALKGVLLKVGDVYYSTSSTTPVDLSVRSAFDSYYTIQGGEFEKLDVEPSKQVVKNYTDSISSTANDNSGYITYTPKDINRGVVRSWNMNKLPTVRTSTLELPSQANESSVWNIELKDGVTLQTPLMNISLEEDFGSLSINLTQEGNIVTLKREISFKKQSITPSEYKKFRNFIMQWGSKKGSVLLFEK